jgi:TolB-like protein/DNA-binding winged helix-turn-helix (wHTH) protein/Tfp pilus assembly protein PilF
LRERQRRAEGIFELKKCDVAQALAEFRSPMIVTDNRELRIGAWRVNPALDEISRDGTTVKLEPRAMRVLVCLAEHAGQVVSIEQLLDAVWKDVVVTPDSVYQAVAGLRRALGDDTKEPAYIANVLRRGYRLVAPVAPWVEVSSGSEMDRLAVEAAPVPVSVSVAPATIYSRVRWSWVFLVVAAALVIGYPIARKLWQSKQATTPGQGATAAAVGEASVAVLPFVDMSDKKDQEYFVDGLSEVLIDRLAMVPGLHVPARTSSFYFKGKQATVPEIAKALGVAHLLEGTVRKSGNTLRITAQLVRVDNGYQVWSETFDRPLTDVFKIQDEIAGAVVQVLKVSIVGHYSGEAARTTNIEAYTLYFHAVSNVLSNGVADYDVAAEDLRSAVTLDPQFAAAWAHLALVTVWKFDVARAPGAHATRASPTQAACADARAAADRALQLDSTLVEPHRAKGIVLQYCDNDSLASEGEFKRALELQPRSSDALRSYAWLALADGRPGQALQLAQRALALDPLNCWNFAALGDARWMVGRLAEAEAAYREAVDLAPTTAGLHAPLASILLLRNKAVEAVAEAEREPDAEWRETALLFALDAAGQKGDADRAIAVYELKHADNSGRIAAFYACRHDAERAIQWLRSFAAKREGEYHDLPYVEACFNNLETDSRYEALQRQMKAENPKPTRSTS